MDRACSISATDWQRLLPKLADSYLLYAPMFRNENFDYELIDRDNAADIVYNHPKPTTPIRTFFFPFKQNVTPDQETDRPVIIMGVPNCDLAALDILDDIYLNTGYTDGFYKSRRENSVIIGSDCYSITDSCHCTSCGINPYPEKNCDLTLAEINGNMLIRAVSAKGEALVEKLKDLAMFNEPAENDLYSIKEKRTATRELLVQKNSRLPDYERCGDLVADAPGSIWESYSSTCVSCGACAVICPTCTCFLLIDRPEFEKIRQVDACQYPGFERVAAGEDPLGELPVRFKNRYWCKYVWKPANQKPVACIGCGRCTDACTGKIDKNQLLEELNSIY